MKLAVWKVVGRAIYAWNSIHRHRLMMITAKYHAAVLTLSMIYLEAKCQKLLCDNARRAIIGLRVIQRHIVTFFGIVLKIDFVCEKKHFRKSLLLES